jgi:P-aminobenzoate N-oxygenase AurF
MSAAAALSACVDPDVWFARASVRSMEMLRMDDGVKDDWRFPSELQPLLAHPAVQALPRGIRYHLSVQYTYKYLNDVCLTETDVVNRTALAMAYGSSACEFDAQVRAGAFAIVVDEAFHSYAARLFALELERVTGIAPMKMPSTNALMVALESTKKDFAHRLHREIELLAACISESTFTAEIVETLQLKDCHPAFQRLLKNHLSDEGRHCGYFKLALARFAELASSEQRMHAGPIAAQLLRRLFDDRRERAFHEQLLLSVGLGAADVKKILRQTGASRSTEMRRQKAIDFLCSTKLMTRFDVDPAPYEVFYAPI